MDHEDHGEHDGEHDDGEHDGEDEGFDEQIYALFVYPSIMDNLLYIEPVDGWDYESSFYLLSLCCLRCGWLTGKVSMMPRASSLGSSLIPLHCPECNNVGHVDEASSNEYGGRYTDHESTHRRIYAEDDPIIVLYLNVEGFKPVGETFFGFEFKAGVEDSRIEVPPFTMAPENVFSSNLQKGTDGWHWSPHPFTGEESIDVLIELTTKWTYWGEPNH